ncbi:C40 family peptidase [Ammoniphilus sp. 3BR4]|uniref:C40 family peptidase n=1 Tax=Ammoniphilus sp. 3BR4 TaxID=3158265 RepID=UPI0034674174
MYRLFLFLFLFIFSATSASAMSQADQIIKTGKQYLNTPYVYGAPRLQDQNFDCSSFTQFIFWKHGYEIGYTTREQALKGKYIPVDQIQKGDLLFFTTPSRKDLSGLEKVGHVAIYLGKGKILHTFRAGIGVTISPIHKGTIWYERYLYTKRVL